MMKTVTIRELHTPIGRVLGPLISEVVSLFVLTVLTPLGHASVAEPDVRHDATVIAIEKVMPSVVNIATETVIEYHDWYDELLRRFYGSPGRRERSMSLGSGVIIDEDGYILTNFHVVRRANRIQVKLWDGREYEAEPWLATAATDIAVVKLRAKPGEKFKPIKFAPDDDLLLGETVLALGNPYGLGGSVTKGILSSKNRRPSNGNEPLDVEDWLQTDAAINPGNSGGPLVNLRGELIGVNVAVYREGESGQRGMGVGFAIPVKQIGAALTRYSTPEMTDSLWFGAQFKPNQGWLTISSVQAGGPASKAGLAVGDQVLEINGQTPRSLISGNRLLTTGQNHRPLLAVKRGGERRDVAVQLMPLEDLIRQRLGLTLVEVPAQTAERLGVQAGEALYIDEVEKNGPAERAHLQRGYFVVGVDEASATKLRNIAGVLAGKAKGDPVRLSVIAPRRLGGNFMELHQATVEVNVR
jgi:S1-C subfamily serine protease